MNKTQALLAGLVDFFFAQLFDQRSMTFLGVRIPGQEGQVEQDHDGRQDREEKKGKT